MCDWLGKEKPPVRRDYKKTDNDGDGPVSIIVRIPNIPN